jgi:hypothetical protein
MTRIRLRHRKPYHERPDLKERLAALQEVIASLRDCNLPRDSKKRMLNHAIWEFTLALGNFAPEFRSQGVLDGDVGTKIEREHVYKRKQIVADIMAKEEPLEAVLKRVVHCVVTKEEHARLKSISATEDGWLRYHSACIEVFRCEGMRPLRMETSGLRPFQDS